MHWTLTDIGALIGTLAGLGSLTWNFVQWRKEQPNLSVKAKVMKPVAFGEVGEDVLCITLVNKAKRPINIKMIAGANAETEFFIRPQRLPRILQEAESLIETYSLNDPVISGDNILTKLYAVDMQDKDWPVSDEQISEINVAIEKYRSTGKPGTNAGTNT